MSPHGSGKAKAEPNETYDNLSQNEQDTFDRIAASGWKPVQAGRGWKAEKDGQESVGPFPDLAQLADAFDADGNVIIDADESIAENSTSDEGEKEVTPKTDPPVEPGAKLHKIAEDHKGNRYLPGQEPIVDSEIAAAAGKYHSIKIDRCNLTTKEVAAKEELIDICHRKRHLFKADPENSNAKIYKVGDLIVRMQNEVKEKVTTEVAE